MTRVDFYVLPPGDERQRLTFACRLTEKAYRQGLNVYLRADDPATARQLDQLLWTFRQGSFIPHVVLDDTDAPENFPVLIGDRPNAPPSTGLIVNLAREVPERCGEARLAEIVGNDQASRLAGRTRYRHYKNLGLEPDTHTLTAWPASGDH